MRIPLQIRGSSTPLTQSSGHRPEGVPAWLHQTALRAPLFLCSALFLGAAPVVAVELSDVGAGVPGFVIRGTDADDQSGHRVSGAGDVNGDGLADLLISGHGGDPAGVSGAGECYVVFGKKTQTQVDLSNLAGGGFVINGIAMNDGLGSSVSGAGDVNGDGLADVIVSAHLADSNGNTDSGECYVVFGKADSAPVNLSALGSGGFVMRGAAIQDEAGCNVSGAGDVNGDGLADVIVGAYLADPGGKNAAGECYVVFGKSSTTSVELSNLGSAGFAIRGALESDTCGRTVSGAGDVNADGLADLVVGSAGGDPFGRDLAGQCHVVFGKATTTPVELDNLGAGGFLIAGAAEDDQAAFVSGAGDVNGDGRGDLIIGAPTFDASGVLNTGAGYVVFGKDTTGTVDLANIGTSGFAIWGANEEDFAGYGASSAGDIDGDGYADLLVGSPGADPNASFSGVCHLVSGTPVSATVTLDTMGTAFVGSSYGDSAGASVSAAGDINGDGVGDIVVGAFQAVVNGNNYAGMTYVLFSQPPIPSDTIYAGYIAAGDAPRRALGVAGDGSNDSTPDARAWIDFDSGSSVSQQAVHRVNDNAAIQNLSPVANVWWLIVSTRTGWSNAEVTFRYTDAEIAGISENTLTIYQAPSVTGPWTMMPTTVDTARNTVTTTATSFLYFALSGSVSGVADWKEW